ncbi:MAG: hypothetical protein Q7S47_02615 [bacterium]|nr:hypothetical protein [bacterium]
MATEFIGMKEFRQNMSTLTKRAQKKNVRYVVLNKNKPVFEVRGLDEKTISLEQLALGIVEAREDVKRGRTYSLEQIRKNLGL